MLLEDVRVVSIALNLPGPAACARLRSMGAVVVKVEPPAGDPLERYVPRWYRELHEGIEVLRLDLKASADVERLQARLGDTDLLVTAQRPSALERLGLATDALRRSHPRLCVLRILGHRPPHEEQAGHDLTYLATQGLVSPGTMPPTLFADMAGAERSVSTALALLHSQRRTGAGMHADVALEDSAEWLAQPRKHGLTGPGAMLGGDLAGYNLYEARDGWVALAALEPHFAQRVAQAIGAAALDKPALAAHFATAGAAHWERWARERDIPLVALHDPPLQDPT
jgi:alpha-methylacyl-CoA racemase